MTGQAGLDRFVLGCSQLGGLYRRVSDGEAMETLETAWEHGVRHFDTAPHYGAGLSERRLGRFLRQVPRESFTLSTKVGRLLVPTDEDVEGEAGFFGGDRMRRVTDYSGRGVLRSLEESLDRLGLAHVDTVYVHDPDEHVEQTVEEAVPALVALRDAGVVRHVGVGINSVAPLARIVAGSAVDQVMLAGRYSLLDQEAARDLLPACAERGVGVVLAGVFNGGLLADPRPGASFDYAEAPAELVRRATALQEACRRRGVSLRAAAMQFGLRAPAVVAVAVGCRGRAQVEDNLRGFTAALPADLWDELLRLAAPDA